MPQQQHGIIPFSPRTKMKHPLFAHKAKVSLLLKKRHEFISSQSTTCEMHLCFIILLDNNVIVDQPLE